jgi:hypothetical protein
MKKLRILICTALMLTSFGISVVEAQWATNGTNIYNTNTGNVGIGTTTPTTLLHVAKNMTEPTITVQNLGGNGGATYTMMDNASGANWKFKATLSGGFKIRDHANSKDVFVIEPNSIANAIYIKTGGNVGIRTTNPQANFHVAEIPGTYTAAFGTAINGFAVNNTSVSIGDDDSYSMLMIGQSPYYNGYMYWNYAQDPIDGYFSIGTYDGSNPLVLQPSGGGVGIGTTLPQGLMEIKYDGSTYVRFGNNGTQPFYFYHAENAADADGQSAIFAKRSDNGDNNHGTNYNLSNSNAAMMGYSFWGDAYSFGVSGFSDQDYTRCGGVIGGNTYAYNWGSLGYKNSSSTYYGGYFTSSTNGSGKSSPNAQIGIGIGAWGDLFGADIHGKVYGTYTEGDNYALYSHGVTYKDNIDVNLQDNGSGTNTPLYTNVSTDVTIMTSGTATLSGGKAEISFDPSFSACVSSAEPVVVTVTPTGSSNGVYLSQVNGTGFTVLENNSGKSNVTVNYIAIGKRAGYEQPHLAKEVVDAGYTTKLAKGLHNDADIQTNGEGLYYENAELINGIHPSTLPNPNKHIETITPDGSDKKSSGF